jgi:hypothetical protein
MSNQKNIDRLFQEKLQGFEQQPKPEVWGNIQNRMQQKKKKRVPIWWYFSGAAAALLLAFLLLMPDNTSNIDPVDPVVTNVPNTNTEDVEDSPSENEIDELKTIEESPVLITEKSGTEERTPPTKLNTNPFKKQSSKTVIADNYPPKKELESGKIDEKITDHTKLKEKDSSDPSSSFHQEGTEKKDISKSNVELSKKTDSLLQKSADSKKKDPFSELKEDVSADKKATQKWSVRPLIAYSNMASSSGSPTDQAFRNNPTSGNRTFNFGVSVSYQINEKFSVRTGVMTQNLSFNTEQVIVSSAPIPSNDFSTIEFREPLSFTLSGASGVNALSDYSSSLNVLDNNAQLNQRINYIEIPVEATYQISNSEKIQTSFIGGFSSLFLRDNELILESNTLGRTSIGTSNNLNSINFSGNLGFGVDYKINKHIFLNVNPMLKVHLNTFSEATNSSLPLFFGVYSGLKYQF